MRKFAAAGIAGLLLALTAVVGVALASTSRVTSGSTTTAGSSALPALTIKPAVTPNKAGTPKHPQGVHLKFTASWTKLGAADQPIVTNINVLFPKGALYQGGKYPTCSAKLLQDVGPSGCKKSSIMGTGSGIAYANTTLTKPQITVVNGGANTVYFYVVLNNPARVLQAIPGHIKKMSGKWAYQLSVAIPSDLQVVAGVPIELTSLAVNAGDGAWLATTSCSGGKWPFQVTATYERDDIDTSSLVPAGSNTYASSVACKK